MRLSWLNHVPWVRPLNGSASWSHCDVDKCDNMPVAKYQFVDKKQDATFCERHLLARGLFSSAEEQGRYDDYATDNPKASYRN